MQHTKQYLQQKMEPFIKQIFQQYYPQQQFKSIYDLFNVQKFYKLLMFMCSLSEEIKAKITNLRLIEDSDPNQTYNEMRKRNFQRIFDILDQTFDLLGLNMRRRITEKDIDKLVVDQDLRLMQLFLEYIFEIFYYNKKIVEFITTLDEEIQANLMELMKNSNQVSYPGMDYSLMGSTPNGCLLQEHIEPNTIQLERLQNHIQQLQTHLHLREQELKEQRYQREQLQQQLQQIRTELQQKNEDIQIYKKRIQSYLEVDQLMLEKDEEIAKLQKKQAQLELRARLRQSEIIAQNKQLAQKLAELESKDIEIVNKFEKQRTALESLTRQKDESQTSMKKVINNLKQKNKSLADKVNELQTELTEIKFEKEIKEKQLEQIKMHFNDGRKQQSTVFDSLISPRSPLKQDLNEGLDTITGKYSKLGEQLSFQLDRADLQDEFGVVARPPSNNRFQLLLQQNYSLKQQLQKVQSSNYTDSKQVKSLQDELQKMKKKLNVMKKRNDEIENQRKEQIDIMVGVIEQCFVGSFTK